jgi:proline iminopeptidase
VSEIVLRGIFTLRRHELEWFYEGGAASIVPDLWEDFVAPIPILERSQMMQAYHRRLTDPDPEVHVPAAVAWSRWEAANLTLRPDPALIASMTEPQSAVAFARIENHYFLHGGWFDEGQLIAGVERIRHIPAVIVQGRYDLCTPAMTAWDLHRAWPEAEFTMVPDAAHAASEPGIAAALRAATDRFAAGFELGSDAAGQEGESAESEPNVEDPVVEDAEPEVAEPEVAEPEAGTVEPGQPDAAAEASVVPAADPADRSRQPGAA